MIRLAHDGDLVEADEDDGSFTIDLLEGIAVPPRVWHFPGAVPGRTVTLLSGDGGIGKSGLGLQACASTVLGQPWIGLQPRRGNALYLSAEDDRDEVHRRVDQLSTFYGERLSEMAGFMVWDLSDRDAVLAAAGLRGDKVLPTAFAEKLEAKISHFEPRLVVLDSAADFFAIDENNRSQVRQVISHLRRLAITYDLAIILLAHPSLTGLSTGSGLSGSTAWNNSVRSRLYMSKPKDDDGGQSAPELRLLEIKKANYGPSGGEYRLRRRGGAYVCEDTSGGAMDRVAAEVRAEQQFLTLLEAFESTGRVVSEMPSKNYAPKLFSGDPRAHGTTSKAFAGAMNRLFADGKLEVVTGGPPSKPHKRLRAAQ